MGHIVSAAGESPVVFSTGYMSRRAAAFDRPNHFYMVGSIGLASAIAIAIAMGLATRLHPRPVWVVDGDASFLMNPASSLMLRSLSVANLRHVVMDNGVNRVLERTSKTATTAVPAPPNPEDPRR